MKIKPCPYCGKRQKIDKPQEPYTRDGKEVMDHDGINYKPHC